MTASGGDVFKIHLCLLLMDSLDVAFRGKPTGGPIGCPIGGT